MTSYECDACGKKLLLGDMFIVTVTRVGSMSGRTYELCKECADKAKSVLAAFVMARKVGE